MGLPVLQFLEPPRSQSLVDGLGLGGVRVVRAAGRRRLRGGQGSRPGVDGAVGGVLRLEAAVRRAGGRGGGGNGGGSSGGDGSGPVGERTSPADRGLVESPRRGLQSPRWSERQQ